MPARRKKQIDPLELKPGDHVVHDQHGVGRYVEMKQRVVQGATREYLVLEYGSSKRGGPPDRLYVPTDQLDQVTRYVGGDMPSLDRLGGADWAKRKGRARKAVRQIAAELIKLYAARQATRGPPVRPGLALAARARGRLPVRRDRRPAHHRRRGQGRHGARGPDGPAGLRRRRLRQDRDRGAGGVQGRPGRQAGRGARADDAAGHAAPLDVRRADGGLPGRAQGAEPLPDRQGGQGGARRRRRRHRRHRHRHPPAAQPRHALQGPRAGHRRRGAALRRRAQGAAQADADRGRRARDVGHADPAHARDGDHRHPRDVDDHHPARGAAPGAVLRRRLRGPAGRRGGPARAAARGPGLLHPQPGAVDREGGGPDPRAGARGAGRHGARPDGGAPARAGDARLLGEALRRARVHHDRGVGPRRLQRQHHDHRARRHPRPLPAAPAARPGRPRPGAGLRLLPLPAGQAADRDRARAAGHPRPALRPRRRHGDRDEGPRDPRRRQPARRRAVAGTSPTSASTSTSGWSARPSTSSRATDRSSRPR